MTEFTYKVGAVVRVTAEELENMLECSRTHYDWKCRQASAECGVNGADRSGFLTVWKLFDLEEGHELSSYELDLLCKIMESPVADHDLYVRFREILREINDRWCELMGKPKPSRGMILHPAVESMLSKDRP